MSNIIDNIVFQMLGWFFLIVLGVPLLITVTTIMLSILVPILAGIISFVLGILLLVFVGAVIIGCAIMAGDGIASMFEKK